MNFEKTINNYIIPSITKSIVSLTKYNYYQINLKVWLLVSAEVDFSYIYISEFKRHFPLYFNLTLETLLREYTTELSQYIYFFYENDTNIDNISSFIEHFINKRLQKLTKTDLKKDKHYKLP